MAAKRKRFGRHANYARMTMFSNCLMFHVFNHAPDVVEHMLHVILGIPLHVTKVHVEYPLKFNTGTGIRMDVHALDKDKIHYNIEIQNNIQGASIERADYNGAAMKVFFSRRKNKKRWVPRTFVIFITSNGYNCHGQPFYRYSLRGQNGEETGVGTVIIFVNGLWRDESDLGKMMHDFGCADPKKMKDAVFAKRVAHVKSDKMVRRSMDEYEARKYRKAEKSGYKKGLKIGKEDGIRIGKEDGIRIGKAHGIRNTALRMLQSGSFSEEQIVEATGLTTEQLQKIKNAAYPVGDAHRIAALSEP